MPCHAGRLALIRKVASSMTLLFKNAKRVQARLERQRKHDIFLTVRGQPDSPWCEILVADLEDLLARADYAKRLWLEKQNARSR